MTVTDQQLVFIDNPAVKKRPDGYLAITVDVAKVLKSWKMSLFSYEWMLPDGRLKSREELPETEQPKRAAVEELLKKSSPLEKPILGIGMLDNVEIGVGRATFLTLAAMGVRTIPVHIPASQKKEFNGFVA